ncbi:MAG: O-antigen ligase family protein [bacterium]
MKVLTWITRVLFFLLLLGMPIYMDTNIASTFGVSKVTFLRFFSFLILGIWVVKLSKQQAGFVKTPLFLPIAFYFIILVLSVIFSRSPILSFFGSYERQEGFITIINYIFLFFAVSNLLERDDIKLVMNTAVLAGTLAALYGIMQHYNYDPLNLSWGGFSKDRVVSTFGNPVFFGAYTIMVLPLNFSLFLLSKRFSFLYGISFLITFLGFLFANTRACYVGLFFEIFIGGCALFILRDKIPKKRLFVLFSIFLICGIVVNLKKETSFIARLDEIKSLFLEKKKAGSTGARLMMWKTGIKMVMDNPILGIGPEAIGITYPYYLYKVYTHDFPFEYEDRMHNDIFDTSVTRGLLGLSSYIFLIFAFFLAGIRLFFKSAYEERVIILGAILGVLGYLVQNEFSFGLPCISSLFWMMMGSLFLLTKQKKQKIRIIKRDKILLFLIPTFFLFIPLFFFYYADIAFRKSDHKLAIRLNPFCHQYRESYGTYLVDMGKNYGADWPDKIILEMSNACRIFKNDGILLSILGMGYEMKQDIDKALPIYEKAIKINPYLGNTYNNLGAIYGNQGRYKEAGNTFLAGLYGFPWDSMLFGNAKKLGLIMLDRGDISDAEEIFSRLTEIYKNKDELISLHKELSLRYLNNGKRDLCIKHLEAILKISPDDAEIKRILGELKN